MMSRPATIAFLSVLALLGSALLIHTFSGAYERAQIPGMSSPMLYPRLLLVAWVALSVLGIGHTLLASPDEEGEESSEPLRVRQTALAMVIVSAATLAMPAVGFAPSMTLAMLLLGWLLGYRRPVMLPVISVLFSFGLWHLFHNLLLIRLPNSPFLPWV